MAIYVNSGEVSNGIVVSNTSMHIYSGGTANETTVNKAGFLHVNNGGSANETVVNSGGIMYVSRGGTANSTVISSAGYLHVYSGGIASNVSWTPCVGTADVDDGATVTFVSDYRGVYFGSDNQLLSSAAAMSDKTLSTSKTLMYVMNEGVADKTAVTSGTLHVHSGGIANETAVDADGKLYVYAGGIANKGTVSGSADVRSQGVANSITVSRGGVLNIWNGGIANSATVNNRGSMNVYAGGTATATAVNSAGALCVSSGGTALNVVWTPCVGSVAFDDGAAVTFASDYRGVYFGSYNKLISSAPAMTGVTFSGHSMYVMNDGTANENVVTGYGRMYVWSGGVAAKNVVIGLGWLYVCSGGTADETAVSSGGYLHVSSAGKANATTVNSAGYLYVSCGGTANATAVNGYGRLRVSSGGTANSAAIGSGGSMIIGSGGKITGVLTVAAGASVSVNAGGILDFDISVVAPGAAARVNDLSLVKGSPDFTITVSAAQAEGSYALADGAADFAGTITVYTDTGTELGMISVGRAIVNDDRIYSLGLASETLTLTVESIVPPPRPTPGDLNGDGRADVIMTITQTNHPHCGATGAWLIQENQTAAWGDLSQRNEGWEIFGTGFTSADKTTNDVYIKSADNIVGAWVTGDDGKVTGWKTVDTFDAETQVLGLGDFDGNGQTDLLLRNINGAVGCYFTGGPSETPVEQKGWNYFQSLGEEWEIAAIGDLNGDGRSDVVLKHAEGFAGSWLTQSDYTMAWANLDTLSDGFEIVGCGDFDGDGTDDVLLKKDNYYGAWLVKNGNAAGWFGIGDLGNVAVEQIADFDGDGIDDLRIRTSAGDLGAQLVRAADTLEWKYYGSVGAEWSTALAAI